MQNSKVATVSVVGLGYIGLPAAAMFASRKVKVIGIDVNQHAIDTINSGKIHIVEPELDLLVHAAVTEGYLRASTVPEPAEAFVIAVPTPFKGDYEPDLSYIKAAVSSIAPVLERGNVIILESTSPVGTTEQMIKWLTEARPDLRFPMSATDKPDVHIAYCPERVLPGQVVRELVQNDRIIGGITPACSERAVDVYRVFVAGELLVTDARTAEMSKLTENAFRDANIAFANELSLICDRLNINVWELIKLANHHPRVNILQPGPGVGGHCIAVDPWFIVHSAPDVAKLIRQARETNNAKPRWVEGKVVDAIRSVASSQGISEAAVKVGCFGLAFKANIDDLRESPSLDIVHTLAKEYRGQLIAVEPNINELPSSLKDLGVQLQDIQTAIAECHVVVMLVDHQEFMELKPEFRKDQILVDAKGVWLN
ncbi:UDP-N-acetyl-D-mannosaminuronic acid dehydrogenase [Achromobacter sp. HZ01]|uniref:UDP-N-acetyl-D-mannosamine dehydrogenase n=1 Tax=Achromobacter sp. HZ01 TaxID=1416886 RepID=UPI000DC3ED7A|nr:UDP-N-acetyl-D-mannosamine dehydrogenase [Achromobacter sp. HZ01]RAP65285.1 UDP-N-acetyl-D-mannosaminuronic acid dehydrogenase [Achromobacter sp. HZ01]